MPLPQNLSRLGRVVNMRVHATTTLAKYLDEDWLNYTGSTCGFQALNVHSTILTIFSILCDKTPLPPPATTPEADDQLFDDDAWIESPVNIDYGFNVKLGKNVFINFHAVFLDTCLISIGSRTLVGPNVSFFSGTHPLDPAVRQGTRGPELGKEIHIGEDCWIGGNVVILPGVNIGRGSVVGAGSVVTRNVPDFTVVAGNPAKVIRKIDTAMDPANDAKRDEWTKDRAAGAEVPMAEMLDKSV
jgi:acetyltransferase-like isoleucine patch superfamily enzyme